MGYKFCYVDTVGLRILNIKFYVMGNQTSSLIHILGNLEFFITTVLI